MAEVSVANALPFSFPFYAIQDKFYAYISVSQSDSQGKSLKEVGIKGALRNDSKLRYFIWTLFVGLAMRT